MLDQPGATRGRCDEFLSWVAQRIMRFPAAGHGVVKDRVNAIVHASTDNFRRDSDLFGENLRYRGGNV
ncbi:MULTISPECIES: hypothetical protein [Paraburkholderia]|uniref:Uncharacterized protein n=1 Tax=Paraburkholderia madseniana TaxID=2599607 RepID=A0AAP5F1G0_9BURK|nr:MULTISPECIES: hypothetical protein [Paraburkholderia]MCX4151534.1 hypothetical protein [Paraburkholderia madseniana]MDN7154465.1 hypothetical protein [Paraburkholderia sp. WS6]MDQ6413347.1 hypothetical protein [Paraburkholderia madseniana]